jgi:hypothetical protein
MSDFVTLTCPSCGGKLQITDDIDRFACAHCGTEHVVRRGGGLVSLAPVVDGIQQVRMGVDKTASELAIRRLSEEIAELQSERDSISRKLTDGITFWLLASVVVLAIFAAVLYAAVRELAVLVFILGVGAVLISIRRVSGRRAEERLAPIDQEILRKQTDLRKHNEIVSR